MDKFSKKAKKALDFMSTKIWIEVLTFGFISKNQPLFEKIAAAAVLMVIYTGLFDFIESYYPKTKKHKEVDKNY